MFRLLFRISKQLFLFRYHPFNLVKHRIDAGYHVTTSKTDHPETIAV
jgi:hypothetical protein